MPSGYRKQHMHDGTACSSLEWHAELKLLVETASSQLVFNVMQGSWVSLHLGTFKKQSSLEDLPSVSR